MCCIFLGRGPSDAIGCTIAASVAALDRNGKVRQQDWIQPDSALLFFEALSICVVRCSFAGLPAQANETALQIQGDW